MSELTDFLFSRLSAALNDIYINQLVKETCEGLGRYGDYCIMYRYYLSYI